MPWWLTISAATLAVRTTFLPLTLRQMKVANRYAIDVKPGVDELRKLLAVGLSRRGMQSQEKFHLYKIFFSGVRATFRKHRVSPMGMFGGALVQLPIFLTFVFTTRHMIRDPAMGPELAVGGAFWFTDLTAQDATMMMPVIAAGLSDGLGLRSG
eukprot:g264.t1